jgi:putative endonuclease
MKNTFNKRKLGQAYEQLAAEYLEDEHGFKIIERNYHCGKYGELDLIGKVKRFQQEYLVFIEVKYRKHSLEDALMAIDYRKQQQLKKLAQLYLIKENKNINNCNISFDIVIINETHIEHMPDIFN